jgi:Uma2 family endonuclease
MASVAGVSVEEYLSTCYRPGCDYLDGEVRERNVGEYPHNDLQTGLAASFRYRQHDLNIRVVVEQRIQVGPRRFRVPDICVLCRDQPIEPVFTAPPLICIEILSKEDRLREMWERVDDYLNFGVPHVWILDPVLRKAYVCTQSGFQEPADGILRVPETQIGVPLAEIFAELER